MHVKISCYFIWDGLALLRRLLASRHWNLLDITFSVAITSLWLQEIIIKSLHSKAICKALLAPIVWIPKKKREAVNVSACPYGRAKWEQLGPPIPLKELHDTLPRQTHRTDAKNSLDVEPREREREGRRKIIEAYYWCCSHSRRNWALVAITVAKRPPSKAAAAGETSSEPVLRVMHLCVHCSHPLSCMRALEQFETRAQSPVFALLALATVAGPPSGRCHSLLPPPSLEFEARSSPSCCSLLCCAGFGDRDSRFFQFRQKIETQGKFPCCPYPFKLLEKVQAGGRNIQITIRRLFGT